MKAEIITIGDELLIGQIVNTNQSYIAEKLNSVGIDVNKMIVVGDVEEQIFLAFKKSHNENDITIVTGGLGPTHDDITKKVICKFFNDKCKLNSKALNNVKKILYQRKIEINDLHIEQAMFPTKAIYIKNEIGTAPGIMYKKNRKYFFAFPGVPNEMKLMMENFAIPFLKKKNNSIILHRTLKTVGIFESKLSQIIGGLNFMFGKHKNTSLAFLPEIYSVKLRITVKDKKFLNARNQIQKVEKKIREKISDYIYGVDNDRLEEVIGKLLTEKKISISVAESCSGGLFSHKITNVSGSSNYFNRGFIVYSNKSKIEDLKVPKKILEKFGAVSFECAFWMAKNVRKISKTNIGVSVTGITGPLGATKEKPVGLVYIGYSDDNETAVKKYFFGEGRERVKISASLAALEILRKKILNIKIETLQ